MRYNRPIDQVCHYGDGDGDGDSGNGGGSGPDLAGGDMSKQTVSAKSSPQLKSVEWFETRQGHLRTRETISLSKSGPNSGPLVDRMRGSQEKQRRGARVLVQVGPRDVWSIHLLLR